MGTSQTYLLTSEEATLALAALTNTGCSGGAGWICEEKPKVVQEEQKA